MAQQYARDQPAGSSNHIKNIAIVGATGSVGEYITKSLLEGGKHVVTAITRKDSKSTMPNGVKEAKVDYEDDPTLVDALKGQDALIITMKAGVNGPQEKLIEAAAKAKVPWVMPNEYTADVESKTTMPKDSGLGPIAWSPEQQVEKLGVSAWIGLACSFWYEFSLAVGPNAYGFDMKNKKVTYFDEGETKIIASTWAQCGRAVANLFSLPILPQDENDRGPHLDQWRNRHVYVSSFLVSQKDMLDSVLRVTGDKESDWTIGNEPAEERWNRGQQELKGGNFMVGYQTCMYTRVFYKDGSGDFSQKLDNDKLGLKEENLDEATKTAVDMVKNGYNYMAR